MLRLFNFLAGCLVIAILACLALGMARVVFLIWFGV